MCTGSEWSVNITYYPNYHDSTFLSCWWISLIPQDAETSGRVALHSLVPQGPLAGRPFCWWSIEKDEQHGLSGPPETWPSLPSHTQHTLISPWILINFWTTTWGGQASPSPLPLFSLPLVCLLESDPQAPPAPSPSVTISFSEKSFLPTSSCLRSSSTLRFNQVIDGRF